MAAFRRNTFYIIKNKTIYNGNWSNYVVVTDLELVSYPWDSIQKLLISYCWLTPGNIQTGVRKCLELNPCKSWYLFTVQWQYIEHPNLLSSRQSFNTWRSLILRRSYGKYLPLSDSPLLLILNLEWEYKDDLKLLFFLIILLRRGS